MAYGGFGLIGALGLDIGSKYFRTKANDLDKALKNAENNLKTEQATQEIIAQKQKKDKVAVD